jgi:hypothetical protein
MAHADLPPVSQSLSMWKNNANDFVFKFYDSAGSVVDVAAWFLLTLSVYAPVNGENCLLGGLVLTGLCSFATPNDTFRVPASAMTSLDDLPSGSYLFAIQGKPLTGDDLQTIASGSLALQSPNDFTPAP